MNRGFRFVLPAISLVFSLNALGQDWPWWRGPDRNGHADPNQDLPIQFSESENVAWSAPIPGRGHGSATVVGKKVFLVAADEEKQTQSVLCFHRDTGLELWKTLVHQGKFPKANSKASHASTTPACDGERLFVPFLIDGALFCTALDLDGKQLWQKKISDYVLHQGYGSSPAIYKDLVIVTADNKGGGAICGLNRKSGEIVWKTERPKKPNYPSPMIMNLHGKDQIVMTGCDRVASFDPLTGKKLWEHPGATTECVTSVVTDGERIFTSGGYPKNHVSAMKADGSGEIVWENQNRVYVPSMLIKEGYLYAIREPGVAICWKSATGERQWQERLKGTFSSSPVMVGDRLYAANESGDFFVLQISPSEVKVLAKNRLGDQTFSTPTICGGQIFVRVAHYDGEERSEKLYCLQKKS